MTTITLNMLRPHEGQQSIIDNAARFNVVPCGRRFGKTTLGVTLLATPETLPYPQGWFSPTYKMLLEVWREVNQRLQPIISRRSIQERRLELITGGVIEFWSMDQDVARGRKYRRIIVDETGLIPGLLDIWNYSLRATLADYEGDAFFFGTPKGRNGFWSLFNFGQDEHKPDWASFTMPSYANPHVPATEFDAMKETLPERVYQQEVMAAFLEDGGGVFRGVMRAVDNVWQDKPVNTNNKSERHTTPAFLTENIRPKHQYIMGVDWGKHNDFTVLTVIDVTQKHVCHVDRFNQIDYAFQADRLEVLAKKFNVSQVIAEQNSMGDAVIEQLRRKGLPVTSFVTTNATKKAAIEALSLAFERDEIRIPNDPILIAELQAYESERLPSGNIRYNAPSGLHDDMVMSLAIGWSGMGKGLKIIW